ncbi:MAG: hypothetical protein HY735_23415 [Verrucomicrobia bacterium]|nr:hypothetical protein [Verrucomicrobiota bacterium]
MKYNQRKIATRAVCAVTAVVLILTLMPSLAQQKPAAPVPPEKPAPGGAQQSGNSIEVNLPGDSATERMLLDCSIVPWETSCSDPNQLEVPPEVLGSLLNNLNNNSTIVDARVTCPPRFFIKGAMCFALAVAESKVGDRPSKPQTDLLEIFRGAVREANGLGWGDLGDLKSAGFKITVETVTDLSEGTYIRHARLFWHPGSPDIPQNSPPLKRSHGFAFVTIGSDLEDGQLLGARVLISFDHPADVK